MTDRYWWLGYSLFIVILHLPFSVVFVIATVQHLQQRKRKHPVKKKLYHWINWPLTKNWRKKKRWTKKKKKKKKKNTLCERKLTRETILHIIPIWKCKELIKKVEKWTDYLCWHSLWFQPFILVIFQHSYQSSSC